MAKFIRSLKKRYKNGEPVETVHSSEDEQDQLENGEREMGHTVDAEEISVTTKDFSLRSGTDVNAEMDYSQEYVVIESTTAGSNLHHCHNDGYVLPPLNIPFTRQTTQNTSLSEPTRTTLMDAYSREASTTAPPQQQSEASAQFLYHSQGTRRVPMQPGLFDQHMWKESHHNAEPLTVTVESLFNQHLVNDGAYTQLFLGTAIISGIENCPMTTAFRFFLQTVIDMKDKTQESVTSFDEFNKCMTSHDVVILGRHPFSNMTWLLSNNVSDNVVICLMSYFARKLNERNCSLEYCNMLKFVDSESQSRNSNEQPLLHEWIPSEMEEIFSKLKEQWEKLQTNQDDQKVISNGVGLVKVFNVVKASEAVMDILPIINKYCKQCFHIIGYNKHETDFTNATACAKSTSRDQLSRLLRGTQKSTNVFLTDIELDSDTDITADHQLDLPIDDIKSELQLENIHGETMDRTHTSIKTIKQNLEKILLDLGQPFTTSKSSLLVMFLCSICAMHSRKKDQLKNDKLFWMSRREIKELYDRFKFPNDDTSTLDMVLKVLMSFGGILYFHDIIALQEYVIVDVAQFVNQIHELYSMSSPTAKFGLISKYRYDDEQYRVICDILTALGIAAEVKSYQIIPKRDVKIDESDVHLRGRFKDVAIDPATTYCYIPTIQKLHTQLESQVTPSWTTATSNHNFSKSFHKSRETTGNLQAKMCSYLLERGCFLVPTEGNNTTVRFFNKATQQLEFDIEFVDDGKELMVHLKNSTYDCKITEAFDRIMETAHLSLYCKANDTESRIQSKNLIKIAKYIRENTAERQEMFTTTLGFTDCEWIKEADTEKQLNKILDMLDEFEHKNSPHKLRRVLLVFDKQLHEFLN